MGTPADARKVPEIGVVYGADIYLRLLSDTRWDCRVFMGAVFLKVGTATVLFTSCVNVSV